MPDAQPGGQPDAPIHGFNLASPSAARRLPCTLGIMAFTVRRFGFPAVRVGANVGRASASHPDFAASPLGFVDRSASINGAVRQLAANFRSPRFPRNVSRRRAGIGRAIMTVSAQVGATRAVRCPCDTAAGRVTRAGFGPAVNVSAALRPNPAFERTRRFGPSTWPSSTRRAVQLVR